MLPIGRRLSPGLCGDLVKNNEEFRARLSNASSGGKIFLGKGVFLGQFVLATDDVDIVGGWGGVTVLRGLTNRTCLKVSGNGCTISGLTVIADGGGYGSRGIDLQGSRNMVESVTASGDGAGIRISGHQNILENLTVHDAENGIQVIGSNNKVNHVKMKNIGIGGWGNCGIWIDTLSKQNVISNVMGSNVRRGIVVNGSKNNLFNIKFVQGSERIAFSMGVSFYPSGAYNRISNLVCSGYHRKKGGLGLEISSSNSSVQDSECGPVRVMGRNASLTNVNCGESICIWTGAKGVTMTECYGQKLVAKTEVTMTNCNFAN